jgi:hypothetical protein
MKLLVIDTESFLPLGGFKKSKDKQKPAKIMITKRSWSGKVGSSIKIFIYDRG